MVDPGNPDHIVVRATFGLLVSQNRGEDWGYVCEQAVPYADYDPAIAVTPSGTTIVGLRDGLAFSSAGGCDWELAADIGSANVVDVSVSRAEPQTSVAIVWDVLAGESRYYESHDDGRSFQAVGSALSFEALTLDVAPSDPNRIYVSGLRREGGNARGVLARSDDRGQTWVEFAVPDSDDVFAPYIAAVHPTDASTIYVRTSGGPGRLYRSRGGGGRLELIWEADIGNLLGFALAPDGSQVAVGTEFDGMFVADADELSFEKRSTLPIRCLHWVESGFYACVNSVLYGDGFIVARADEAISTLSPLLELACVRPLECSDDSRAGFFCRTVFDELAPRIDADTCGGAGGSGGAEPPPPPPPKPAAGGGCDGCSMNGTGSPWLFVFGLLMLLRRRLTA